MSCQYLSCYIPADNSWSVASCLLNGIPYIPSVQELENYCKPGRHQQCPAFFQSSLPFYDKCFWPELEAVALAQGC
jgi:hypothetical protein